MVRDWAVIKEILERTEARTTLNGASFSAVFPEHMVDGNYKKDEETEVLRYHLNLLADTGFLTASFGIGPSIKGLTWQGHDLLDEIRSSPSKYR